MSGNPASSADTHGLAVKLREARLRLLDLHQEANSGHIGGNFSCIDALMTLHHAVMGAEDRFVLSKGHSAGALYVTLWSLGKISEEQLKTFCKEGTKLPGHPSGNGIPDLLFSTGSLGHGPSLGAGLALAARHQQSPRHVYVLCSDGEWQEGGCWEALIFAVAQKLDNLTILIDQNGWQGFGSTQEVIGCADLTARISAFGADVRRANGHAPDSILAALAAPAKGAPRVVILDTVKGNGLHFAGSLASHYLPVSAEEYTAGRETLLREDEA